MDLPCIIHLNILAVGHRMDHTIFDILVLLLITI